MSWLPIPILPDLLPHWFVPRVFVVKTDFDSKRCENEDPTLAADTSSDELSEHGENPPHVDNVSSASGEMMQTPEMEMKAFAVLRRLQGTYTPRLYGRVTITKASGRQVKALALQYIHAPLHVWEYSEPDTRAIVLSAYECFAKISEYGITYCDPKLDNYLVTAEVAECNREVAAGMTVLVGCVAHVAYAGWNVYCDAMAIVLVVLLARYFAQPKVPSLKVFVIDFESVDFNRPDPIVTNLAGVRELAEDLEVDWKEIKRTKLESGDSAIKIYERIVEARIKERKEKDELLRQQGRFFG